MDFALTGEQQALRDTARAYLTDERAGAAADRVWADLTGLGWLDPDLGTVELALLAEQLGQHRHPVPWWAAVGLAGPALRAAGRAVHRPATLAWVEPKAAASLTCAVAEAECTVAADGSVTGRKVLVPHSAEAAELVVVARGTDGVELRLVDLAAAGPRAAVTTTVGTSPDPTRPRGTVELAGAPSVPLVDAGSTPAVLALARHRTLALLAAEAVGIAARALAEATRYAAVRTQFGRPIGANQAVAHPLVEVYGQVEVARSLAYRAAWAVDGETGPVRDRAVAAATVAAREAALSACEAAIQTLGGNGFTWEQSIHHWYRRAWWLSAFEGTVADFRAELAGLLLDRPEGQEAPGR